MTTTVARTLSSPWRLWTRTTTIRTPGISNRFMTSTTSMTSEEAGTTGSDEKKTVYPPNNTLKVTALYNRNPRNLEKLRIAPKPQGWFLEKVGRCFWNKVTLDISSKHITSNVIHFHGYTPVTASTREWCIRKYLYSTIDSAAMEAVGTVFAHRCVQSGIFELYCAFTEEDRKKPKIKIFLDALVEGGIVLTEPNQIYRADWPHHPWTMDRPWEFYEDPETGEIVRETPVATECNTFKCVTDKPFH